MFRCHLRRKDKGPVGRQMRQLTEVGDGALFQQPSSRKKVYLLRKYGNAHYALRITRATMQTALFVAESVVMLLRTSQLDV